MAPEKPENQTDQPDSTDSPTTENAQTPADAQPAAQTPADVQPTADAAAPDSDANAKNPDQNEAPDADSAADASADATADTANDTAAQAAAPQPTENDAQAPELPDFAAAPAAAVENSIEMLNDVDLDVKIELGRAEMTVEEILRLTNGSVVELDRLAGDPVDIMVNEKLIARGEVLVVNDNFCVRINEIVKGIGQRIAEASQT